MQECVCAGVCVCVCVCGRVIRCLCVFRAGVSGCAGEQERAGVSECRNECVWE